MLKIIKAYKKSDDNDLLLNDEMITFAKNVQTCLLEKILNKNEKFSIFKYQISENEVGEILREIGGVCKIKQDSFEEVLPFLLKSYQPTKEFLMDLFSYHEVQKFASLWSNYHEVGDLLLIAKILYIEIHKNSSG